MKRTLCLLVVAVALVGADTVFGDLGRQLGEVESAIRKVQSMRQDADRKQQIEMIRCLDGQMMWLSGLEIAGRAAIDEYAVARLEGDEVTMGESVQKMDRVSAQTPLYLAEAKACREASAGDTGCGEDLAPGETCTEWRVDRPRNQADLVFSKVSGGTTRPPDSSPLR